MRLIKLPRPEMQPSGGLSEAFDCRALKPRFRMMKLLEEKRRQRNERKLEKVNSEIVLVNSKRVFLQMQDCAKEENGRSCLDYPPTLRGLWFETVSSAMKIFPAAAALLTLLASRACSMLVQVMEPQSKAEIFKGYMSVVAVGSAVITSWLISGRSRLFLNDVRSQLARRLDSLMRSRSALHEKLGYAAIVQDENETKGQGKKEGMERIK